jgi:uncharacterized protein
VVKAGDVVRVKVLEVDLARKRIGLSMRLDDAAPPAPADAASRGGGARQDRPRAERPQGAMAAAFAQAKDQNNDRGKR